MSHWLTRYDPENGEPYGTVCDCDLDENHDGYGEITFPQRQDELPAALAAGEGETPDE